MQFDGNILPDTTVSTLANVCAVSQQEFRDLQMTFGTRLMKWRVSRIVFGTWRTIELLQTISSHILQRNTNKL